MPLPTEPASPDPDADPALTGRVRDGLIGGAAETLDPEANVAGWLRTVVRNASRDILARERRVHRPVPAQWVPTVGPDRAPPVAVSSADPRVATVAERTGRSSSGRSGPA